MGLRAAAARTLAVAWQTIILNQQAVIPSTPPPWWLILSVFYGKTRSYWPGVLKNENKSSLLSKDTFFLGFFSS